MTRIRTETAIHTGEIYCTVLIVECGNGLRKFDGKLELIQEVH
jgi:hypothetical protein